MTFQSSLACVNTFILLTSIGAIVGLVVAYRQPWACISFETFEMENAKFDIGIKQGCVSCSNQPSTCFEWKGESQQLKQELVECLRKMDADPIMVLAWTISHKKQTCCRSLTSIPSTGPHH